MTRTGQAPRTESQGWDTKSCFILMIIFIAAGRALSGEGGLERTG